MKKASSFIALLLLGSLMADAVAQTLPGNYPGNSFPPYTQPGHSQSQIISERVMQTMQMHQRLQVDQLLRLSQQEAKELEIVSLTILAQGVRGQAQLDILEKNRAVSAPQIIKKKLTEVRIQMPAQTKLQQLELAASGEIMIDTITAEVRLKQGQGGGQGGGHYPLPDPQPMPGQLVRLQLNHEIRISGELPLKQLAKQQLGLSLEGAQIERIALEASVIRGVSALVQVELNQRIVASKSVSGMSRATPLLMNSMEEVRGNLRLIVRGDVIIHSLSIRVGNVRPTQPIPSQPQRIMVGQEISSGRPLEVSRLLPYETRLIQTIALEARTRLHSQAEVAAVAFGQVVGSVIVSQVPMRPVIQLLSPVSARDLRIQSLSPVIIDAIEVGFDGYQVW